MEGMTVNELLEALTVAKPPQGGPADAFTAKDVMEASQCGATKANRILTRFKLAGQLEVVDLWREALDGQLRRTVGYRFKKRAKCAR